MFYAVAKGRKPGIYNTWNECQKQVKGFKGSKFKKFTTKIAAELFIEGKHKVQRGFASKIPTLDTSIIEDSLVYVFTDGACINNGRKNARGGSGVFYQENSSRNISIPVPKPATNNKAELLAILEALKEFESELQDNQNICIISDSKYSLYCITSLYHIKAVNEKKPNHQLIAKIMKYIKAYPRIQFKHIKAHTGYTDFFSKGNEWADRLANEGVKN